MLPTLESILAENKARLDKIHAKYDPVRGIGCVGVRFKLCISDYISSEMFVNEYVHDNDLIKVISAFGSIRAFITEGLQQEFTEDLFDEIVKSITRILLKWDFEFCAATIFWVKDKETGDELRFILRKAQRKLLASLLAMFYANKPIRIILLKARQWGGSTLIQIFCAWIQLFHKKRWNSNIVAQVKDTSYEIKGMYSYLLTKIPEWVLMEGELPEFKSFERSSNISYIPGRNCKVKIGTYNEPDAARGGDSAMVHCSEIGLWHKTDGKKPEDIIRSACSGVSMAPMTLIAYESTANGTGNYFHKEWLRAKRGSSDKKPVFVSWFEIPEMYFVADIDEAEMYNSIWINPIDLYWSEYEQLLFSLGATLQGIAWYRQKRKEYDDHGDMMSEYPSTDEEAFQNSGSKVFKTANVLKLRNTCKPPMARGYIRSNAVKHHGAFDGIEFVDDIDAFKALMKVWEYPDTETLCQHRYKVIVDVGGRSNKSDPSDIVVFDRYWMIWGGKPEVVAEWYGHVDHDLLVWIAAKIAHWYCKAELVIESNTLESERNDTDGDHTQFILEELKEYYDALYCRTDPQKLKEGIPAKYGFQTNRSSKTMIIDKFTEVLREEGYIEREDGAVDEIMKYERKQNGSYGNPDGKDEHDDRVITRMIGCFVCYEQPYPQVYDKNEQMYSRTIVNEASI